MIRISLTREIGWVSVLVNWFVPNSDENKSDLNEEHCERGNDLQQFSLLGVISEWASIDRSHVVHQFLVNVVADLAIFARFGIDVFLHFAA